MSPVLAMARKEWRAAFLSPVALIFLLIFLAGSLFVFFWVEGFFARNIADVRPFFQWMPVLLVLLASAFTMRLWSEEARSGTLEVLLTLPIRVRNLVLGKFLAGMGLVAVALLLTLPVPIMVEFLGDLDWGPVIGGYLGLLLLAAAYLALGMFVSSLTSNALVSLLMSMVACGFLLLIGYLPSWMSTGMAVDEVFRALGTGSRFESMLRGVLDVRDLVYYASLAGMFLVLNGLSLERARWGGNPRTRRRRSNMIAAVVLLGINLLVCNLGLAMAGRMRADLTAWNQYSVSPVTRDLLRGLAEPLLVRGYFSSKTHPLLAPLVPQVRDFLRELDEVAGDDVTVEFVDPTADEEAEREAKARYGIRTMPFRFSGRHQESVVNAYFHILVRYGDGYEVLGFEDLIDVEIHGTDVDVRLRNLEYDLARAIQKVVYGFRSLESVCNQLAEPARLRVFASSKNLPQELAEVPGRIRKVAEEFSRRCGDRLSWEMFDPDQPGSGWTPEELHRRYGVKPMSLSLFDDRTFYLDLVLEMGDRKQVLDAGATLSEADIRKELQAALQRFAPGFLKTVGLAPPAAPSPSRMPGMPPGGGDNHRTLRRHLEQTYEVVDVDLGEGRVPGHVDVLLVVDPRDFGEKERYAIDQFLMRGGSVVIAAGSRRFNPSYGGKLDVQEVETGLDELLAGYGVETGDAVVLDRVNQPFPVPVVRDLGGGIRVEEIQLVDYPPFVRVQGEGLSDDSPATVNIPVVVLHWPSPVKCKRSGEEDASVPAASRCLALLSSSDQAWRLKNFDPNPDFANHPETGYTVPGETERIPLAVSVTGPFDSHYRDRPPPVFGAGEDQGDEDAKEDKDASGGRRAGVIGRSPASARLVVVGSSAFLDDLVLAISGEVSDVHLANLQFVTNLADWSVQDVALMSIRSHERYARTLTGLEEGDKLAWEAGMFGYVLVAMTLIYLLILGLRSGARPILETRAAKSRQGGEA